MFPVPPENPVRAGELAVALQVKVVPLIFDSRAIDEVPPEQMDCENEGFVIAGVGSTYIRKSAEVPEHPLAAGMIR